MRVYAYIKTAIEHFKFIDRKNEEYKLRKRKRIIKLKNLNR